MIKIENVEVVGWEPSIRGMRNPKNSWDKSDSRFNDETAFDIIGKNDLSLASTLSNGGRVHAKYRRYIDVYLDITAPLYWWKEFKTYRKGRQFLDDEDLPFDGMMDAEAVEDFIEMNSCSTMHKIQEKEFVIEDFSVEHLKEHTLHIFTSFILESLNFNRQKFIETKDKEYWWQMIQLLPSSYNQKRTVKLNYEVLANMYKWRKDHKLDEWVAFCKLIEKLPYSELITGGKTNAGNQ